MKLRFSPQTRRVFHLSLPIFAELLLQLLVGNVDQFMLSHFGSAAVSAVGNGNQVMNVVVIVLETMSSATTILLTQHIGAGRQGEACDEIATVGVAVSAAFSAVMGLLLLCVPHVVFTILRTPAEAFDSACLYTRIVGGTVLVQGLYIELCAVLRSYTLLKEVVTASVVMNLLNVAGNAVLINGWLGLPRLGVTGAAISTCVSKAVGLTLVIWTLRQKCGVRFSVKYLRPFPMETFQRLLGIATPSGAEALSYNVSQIFILRFINLMGTTVIATKVYASMLANVAYVYSIAVAQATQILIGYMLGARKLDEVTRRVWSTIRIALVISELLTLCIFLFSDPIYSIFTPDPAIHALGRQIILVEFALEIGRSVNIVMTRCLTTAGDVWYPVIVGISSQWLVAVLGSWLLGHVLGGGLVGIWAAMACDEGLRGLLFLLRFRKGTWREKRLVE
ncbi:MAG: MATE family efflux transporter [Dysosmobacter sp.]|nr:MATE family efflux transporter [Dysosmobacter sp.]